MSDRSQKPPKTNSAPLAKEGKDITPPKQAGSESQDVALICGASEDGKTLGVLRQRGDQVEAAVMKRAEEGQPVVGELLSLKPRPDDPLLCDVSVLHPGPGGNAGEEGHERTPKPSRRVGPAQVSNDKYRSGWDRLFANAKKPDPDKLN